MVYYLLHLPTGQYVYKYANQTKLQDFSSYERAQTFVKKCLISDYHWFSNNQAIGRIQTENEFEIIEASDV